MAITVLGSDSSANGDWQIDYDTVGLTIGHTCTSDDPNAQLTLMVTVVQTQATFTKDVTGDLNQGRVVDFSGVPNNLIPAHVKGQVYPVTFGGSWTP